MLAAWAARWQIPPQAIAELSHSLGAVTQPDSLTATPGSEAAVQNAVRMEAARRGCRLFRNNSGVAVGENNVPVRYGLCNESKKINAVVKSSDLIGIGPDGRFLAYEVKRSDWHYTGTERERAQLAFITFINSMGGRAAFITSPEQL
jgi:hypothetical protein